MKKSNSTKKGKEKSNKPGKIERNVLDLLPFAYYDTSNDFYVLDDNSCINLYQIITKDLANASDDEKEMDCLRFAKFYKMYLPDIKIIIMNYPCNTQSQQAYIRHKLEVRKNPVHRKWLDIALRELQYLESHATAREFYLLIFADDTTLFQKQELQLQTLLNSSSVPMIEKISKEKKEAILYKLNNKNCIIH